jgi:hypothetical protein
VAVLGEEVDEVLIRELSRRGGLSGCLGRGRQFVWTL